MAAVTVRGVKAAVAYRMDRREHSRRQDAGLTAVTRLDWLHTLLSLPAGMPVPSRSLPSRELRMLHRLPTGCVQFADGTVIRHIVRPLRVDLAVVMATDFRSGLREAGRFGAYCARVLAVAGTLAHLAEARAEADYYGIGLVVNSAARPVLVVPPEPFTPSAHTAAGWRFAEQTYRELITSRRAA
jgi:hypothetical protein